MSFNSPFSTQTQVKMMVDKALLARLPSISEQLFNAKASKKLTFEQIGKKLGRNEIWVASVFYGRTFSLFKSLIKTDEV